ncbi:hypothetical protein EK21DRAFT_109338 [Setomelanomma holmii]|uniref:Uncharacterized protein n=1 Tax=Setomelanomma holmii TaxID=210430 RepID=A0A9P4HE90_9PLEO|nr:hypothetical protein EK21DRAFT_109338 [Setomelanomma holmii]
MRGIPALSNCTIDMFHEPIAAAWFTSCYTLINFVHNNTLQESTLRKFVLDAEFLTRPLDNFQQQMAGTASVLKEVLLDIMRLYVQGGEKHKGIGRKVWTKVDRCQWQDHSGPGGKLRLEARK